MGEWNAHERSAVGILHPGEMGDAGLAPPLRGSEPQRQLAALIESLRAARRSRRAAPIPRAVQGRAG